MRRPTLLLNAIVALIGFMLLIGTGVAWATAVLLVVAVGAESVAGGYWWRLARRRAIGPVEELGMGLALGTAGAMLAGLIGLLLSLPIDRRGWLALLPALVTLAVWLIRRLTGRRVPAARPLDRRSLSGVVIGGLVGGIALLANLRNYPLHWSGQWDRMHPDMLFFQALSTSSAGFGPGDSMMLSGHDIRYHWLVYAWAGQLDQIADAAPFVVLTRVLPFVSLIACVAIAAGWAARASRIPWVPTLATVLIASGGYLGAAYGTVLNIDSPSQAMSSAWLLAFSVVVLAVTRGSVHRGALVLIAVLAIAMSGGKVSTGAVAVGAIVVLAAVGLIRREPWRIAAVWAAVVSVIALAGTYVWLLAGSGERGGLLLFRLIDKASSVQGLNPTNSRLGVLVGTVILVLAVVPRWAGAIWLVADRRTRGRPITVYGVGLAVVGALTLVIVSGGLNDTWFALAASAPLAVISAVGCGRAVRAITARRWPTRTIWVSAVLGMLIAGIVWAIWATGPIPDGWRWLGPIIGVVLAVLLAVLLAGASDLRGSRMARTLALAIVMLVVAAVPSRAFGVATSSVAVLSPSGLTTGAFSPFLPFIEARDQVLVTSISDDQLRVGRMLAERSSPSEVIATNVTFSPLVPALTSRPTFVSGIKYQAPYGRAADVQVMLDRELASHAFIDGPTDKTLAPLCDAGVRWVWIDPERTANRQWAPYADIVASTPTAIALELTGCPRRT